MTRKRSMGIGHVLDLVQFLVLTWVWARFWFCCGCGPDSCSDVALVCSWIKPSCCSVSFLQCWSVDLSSAWIIDCFSFGGGWGRVGVVGWGSTCAQSISAADENLKTLHLTTLEHLLTLGKNQLVVLNRHIHCLSGDQHILFTVLDSSRTFRSKVIRDMMWWTEEMLMNPDLKWTPFYFHRRGETKASSAVHKRKQHF